MGGFEAGFKETFPDADFRMDEKSGLPTGDGYTVPEVIATVGPYLLANDDVNLFFHTDQGVEGVGIVIRDNNMAGKVWTSGFNVSDEILNLIDQDIILVTINQGFDNQAEAAVRACVDYLVDGIRAGGSAGVPGSGGHHQGGRRGPPELGRSARAPAAGPGRLSRPGQGRASVPVGPAPVRHEW